MTKGIFTEKPEIYSYFPLDNGMADVFIRKFDHTEVDEDGNTSYVCNCNEFRVKQSLITEDMIAENPDKYLSYTQPKPVTELERLEAVEAALLDLMGVSYE